MKRRYLLYAAIFALLIFVAVRPCGAHPSKSTLDHLTLKDVEQTLLSAGMQVRRGVQVEQPYLHAPGTVLIVNGENRAEAQTYIYDSSAAREKDTSRLNPKTAAPPTVLPTWIAPPSLVLKKNVALIVLTRDEELRKRIAKAFVGE